MAKMKMNLLVSDATGVAGSRALSRVLGGAVDASVSVVLHGTPSSADVTQEHGIKCRQETRQRRA